MDYNSRLYDLVGQGIFHFINELDHPDSIYIDPNKDAIEVECVEIEEPEQEKALPVHC